MIITGLCLENFRNIRNLSMIPSEGVNIIYGDNAQGKTNLIEALWLCTGSKSFRSGTKYSQMIQFDSQTTHINMDFLAQSRNQNISIALGKGEKQHLVKLNKVKKSSLSALSGAFCAVVFSPSHLDLVTGSPDERRRFVDYAISQLKPHYIDLLQKYQKCLFQRNSLLRNSQNNKTLLDTIDIWNQSLAGFGTAIMDYRFRYIQKLRKIAAMFYDGISGRKEIMEIAYNSSIQIVGDRFDIKGVSEKYLDLLDKNIDDDIRSGYTLAGIHRDDLSIKIGGKSAKNYASQGQKRSAVLAMKLAESELIKQTIGEEPTIFLDDVMSELDEKRQEYILKHLDGKQVFITCCDKTTFDGIVQEKLFHISGGKLSVEV